MPARFRRLLHRPWSPDDERLVVFVVIAAIVLFRSAMFVFEKWLDVDSDQKHLSEGRAFPLLMYGQNYVLAVEAWLAAPLFVIFGASVPARRAGGTGRGGPATGSASTSCWWAGCRPPCAWSAAAAR
jgi:hypothetical protein